MATMTMMMFLKMEHGLKQELFESSSELESASILSKFQTMCPVEQSSIQSFFTHFSSSDGIDRMAKWLMKK